MSKKDKPLYAMAVYGSGAVLMEMQPDGIEFRQASPDETQMALRLGVVCMNTGKTERQIYEHLERITS